MKVVANRKFRMGAVVLTLAMVIITAAFWFKGQTTEYTVHHIYPAICTEDISRSACGDSNIEVMSGTGEIKTLVQRGFSSGNDKRYLEISHALSDAYESKSRVRITVRNGAIVQVVVVK